MRKLILVTAVLVCLAFVVSSAHASPITLDWTMAADPLTTWANVPGPLNPVEAFSGMSVSYTGGLHSGSWFTDYYAAPTLPQMTGGDLDKYAWTMTMTLIPGSRVGKSASYNGEMLLYAPGYGYTPAEYLEKASFTVDAVFNNRWTSAALSGDFLAEVGARQPAGWPVPVDWSSVNPMAVFEGTWSYKTTSPIDPPHVDGKDYIEARVITTVPEPGTIMAAMALLAPAGLMFRRRMV